MRGCTESGAWARVDELAAYLTAHGIAFTDDDGQDSRGVDLLGELYHVYSNSSESMARHYAWSFYRGSVEPDRVDAGR
ncbi:MAG: hypothetical protein GEV10_31860 [Streptosporangiales bacterium]|nr:hypothetical protein [Streptosporangiales bacterium]